MATVVCPQCHTEIVEAPQRIVTAVALVVCIAAGVLALLVAYSAIGMDWASLTQLIKPHL
jgi:small-conductance mechanosensitive channel